MPKVFPRRKEARTGARSYEIFTIREVDYLREGDMREQIYLKRKL